MPRPSSLAGRIITIFSLAILISLSFIVLFENNPQAHGDARTLFKRDLAPRQLGSGLHRPSGVPSFSRPGASQSTPPASQQGSQSTTSSSSSTSSSKSTTSSTPPPITRSSSSTTTSSSSLSTSSSSPAATTTSSSSKSTVSSFTSSSSTSSSPTSSSLSTSLTLTSPSATHQALTVTGFPSTIPPGTTFLPYTANLASGSDSSDASQETDSSNAGASSAKPQSFLKNTAAVVATFVVLALVLVGALIVVIILLRKRHRKRELNLFEDQYIGNGRPPHRHGDSVSFTSGGPPADGTLVNHPPMNETSMEPVSYAAPHAYADRETHFGAGAASAAAYDMSDEPFGLVYPPAISDPNHDSVVSNHAGYGVYTQPAPAPQQQRQYHHQQQRQQYPQQDHQQYHQQYHQQQPQQQNTVYNPRFSEPAIAEEQSLYLVDMAVDETPQPMPDYKGKAREMDFHHAL